MNDMTINPAIPFDLPALYEGRHMINGAWVDSASGQTFERRSPSHGHIVSRSALGGEAEAEAAILAARSAFDSVVWSRASGKDRAAVLLKVADLIEQNVERIAVIETLESGKPISQSRGEVGGASRPLALCRVAGAQHPWRQPQHSGRGHDGGGAERAYRSGIAHHAVELPVLDSQPETALCAGCGLYSGCEAVGNDPVDHCHVG